MISEEFKVIGEEVKNFLKKESSGHDFYHAERVFNNAMYLQKLEGGDLFVIGVAALTHDILRPWEKETGKSHFGDEAMEIIREILVKAKISEAKIDPILKVVKLHDVYDWSEKMNNKTMELKIVQDADNLDALGAIGIGRNFAFGGSHGLPMYNPGESLKFNKDFVEDPQHMTSPIAHFYEKLFRLKDNMNTKTGKKLAEERHRFMEKFMEQFFIEWNGKFE